MKNILTILLLFICFIGFGQSKPYPVTDSLNAGGVTGTDTVWYIQFYDKDITSIEFEYTDLNADDATFDHGYSNFGNTHNTSDTDTFPFILNVTANQYSNVDGVNKATFMVIKNEFNCRYISIRYVKNSVTSGWIRYSFIK